MVDGIGHFPSCNSKAPLTLSMNTSFTTVARNVDMLEMLCDAMWSDLCIEELSECTDERERETYRTLGFSL